MIEKDNEIKIDDAIFRFVEHELYYYEENKRELKEMNFDDIETLSIGNQLPYDRFSSTKRYPEGSITENISINLISNKVARRMERTLVAIEKVKRDLDREKGQLFELKYINRKSWQYICAEIGISRRTYYRWRDFIVIEVAKEMGLIE